VSVAGLDALYGEIILDHARRPHRAGLREPFDAEVHHVNPTCGDEVRLRVALTGSGPEARVTDVSYEALGCSISIAGASVMADEVTGGSAGSALARYDRVLAVVQGRAQADPEQDGDVAAFAGVSRFPARVKCALLAWAAMRDALSRAVDAADAPGRDGRLDDGSDAEETR
jgi:nitrogen fixation protein NifU and related proteins